MTHSFVLQGLPASVRMVSAFTPLLPPLRNLAEMADKLPQSQPSLPLMATAAPNLSTEVENLRADVPHLEQLIQILGHTHSSFRSSPHTPRHSPTWPHPLLIPLHSSHTSYSPTWPRTLLLFSHTSSPHHSPTPSPTTPTIRVCSVSMIGASKDSPGAAFVPLSTP